MMSRLFVSSGLAATALIDAVVDMVIVVTKFLTGDFGGKAGTTQMGDAIAAAL